MKKIGDSIGHIRLVEHLGTGGMGDIFVGHDQKLGRQVAVKAIRPENLSDQAHQRLVREAQLLSSLDHENICRIYELLEEDGRIFLVLELIRGRDLRQVIESGLGHRQKLELAEKIARALDFAHRNEIIHRDLKLENVMVREDGVLKVLDFGVARSLDSPPARSPGPPNFGAVADAGKDSSLTILGEAVGTVTTMSPEQASGDHVTAATDQYSLGLLLQELFTGKPPYPPGLSISVLWLKAVAGDTLPVEGLGGELTSLIQELKSLQPADRPSASETARRLRSIAERPRRRLRLAAVALVLGLVAAASAKYTFDLRRERNAAVEARLVAERHGRESDAVVEFLVGLFEATDPGATRGRDPRASEILDQGAEKVESKLLDQPLVRARLMETIGQASRLLGQTAAAERHLTGALEIRLAHQAENHPDVARTRSDLGDLLRVLGRYDEAVSQLESSLLASEQAGDRLAVAETINRLGAVALETGDLEQAARYFRRTAEIRRREMGDEDSMVIAARNNLAIVQVQLGQLEAAAAEHQEILRVRRHLYGDDHPDVGTSLNNLAVVRFMQGRLGASEQLMREALGIWKKVYGESHPEVATAISNLGELALGRGELDEAEVSFRQALEMWRATFGGDHPDLAYAWHGLGHVARRRGDRAAAAEAYREALRLRESALAADHPEVMQVRSDLEDLLAAGPGG